MLEIRRYSPDQAERWNRFVAESKNGTFLLDRGYMDYHAARFTDHSLMIFDVTGELLAVLPANEADGQLVSHGGLTYGGLVTGRRMSTQIVLQIFTEIRDYLAAAGRSTLIYKSIPAIYHKLPADEDKYALFRLGARLHRADTLSVVIHADKGPIQSRRQRGAKKAQQNGIEVGESQDWAQFWEVLSENLRERHNVAPTHTLAEMLQLRNAFPAAIKLFISHRQNEILAGTVIYLTDTVAHAQYIASRETGRAAGALDRLFLEVIPLLGNKRFFDFGTSTIEQGRVLNHGLIEFKESLGARTILHEHYTLAAG